MPAFRCSKCGCMENSATSNYVSRQYPYSPAGEKLPPLPLLCSECDPEIGKWHGAFPKRSAKGSILASDGFLYANEDVASDSFKFRIKHQGLKVVREITED